MFSTGGDLVLQVGLPDKVQDAQLNQHFRSTTDDFEYRYVPNIA